MLRTESIASSKVEGLQVGMRELARAEARVDAGGRASQTAIDILANIDAMELAIRDAASVRRFGVKQIVTIHRRLMQNAPNAKVAGRMRTQQNWIGGDAGVLVPLSSSARKRSWEATGLLDLLGGLEAGQLPSGK